MMLAVELVLDSGEKRMIKTGEILVHHRTMHGWRNTSQMETARMVLFVIPAEKSAD
jgi:hypothetical protein